MHPASHHHHHEKFSSLRSERLRDTKRHHTTQMTSAPFPCSLFPRSSPAAHIQVNASLQRPRHPPVACAVSCRSSTTSATVDACLAYSCQPRLLCL
ncbi:hypothetical protein L208DRAFT_185757 [Tricholoma matsutake]|nr:hypothetical protein L208DRAFT_185757 [Tricholoma matsutake 945]